MALVANLNSYVLDYVARQKLGGSNFNYFVLEQLPVLGPAIYGGGTPWAAELRLEDWIAPRALELAFTSWDLRALGSATGLARTPFVWDEARRSLLSTELDAAFFHLYGLTRGDVEYVMETFPIVCRQDEERFQRDFRSKRLILERYDALAAADAARRALESPLDPPPGDPRAAHRAPEPTAVSCEPPRRRFLADSVRYMFALRGTSRPRTCQSGYTE